MFTKYAKGAIIYMSFKNMSYSEYDIPIFENKRR